jgi:hypothetical protein
VGVIHNPQAILADHLVHAFDTLHRDLPDRDQIVLAGLDDMVEDVDK